MQVIRRNGAYVMIVGSLVVLPNCGLVDWMKDQMGGIKPTTKRVEKQGAGIVDDASPVLATMDGTPIVTEAMAEKEYVLLIKSNPQIEAMLPFMGGKKGMMKNIASSLADRKSLERYVTDRNLQANPEYQQELDRMIESVKVMLNAKYFSQEFPIAVTDNDTKKFYDDNKASMPELLVSRGGVQTTAVAFDTKADAQAFLQKAQSHGGDLNKAAEGSKLEVKDLQLVNNQSIGIDAALRSKIMNIKKTPSTELIALSDSQWWVVSALKKEDAVYREFNSVQSQLKQFLQEKKRKEVVEKEMGRIKEEYNIKLNDEYFKQEENAKPAMAAAAPAPHKQVTTKVAQAKQAVPATKAA